MKSVSILIVDDHAILRQGLAALLRAQPTFQILGEAGSGREALAQVESLRPEVLILDIGLPDMSGLDVLQVVTSVSPMTRTLILTMHADEAYVHEALRCGAMGYMLKESTAELLVMAVQTVASGKHYLDPQVSQYAIDAFLGRQHVPSVPEPRILSSREFEVVGLAARGLTASAVAERLRISPRTAESHRSRAMKKLGIKTQAQLFQYAMVKGLLKDNVDRVI